jgi:hypothetical protein
LVRRDPKPPEQAAAHWKISVDMAERGGFEPPVEVLAPTTV